MCASPKMLREDCYFYKTCPHRQKNSKRPCLAKKIYIIHEKYANETINVCVC